MNRITKSLAGACAALACAVSALFASGCSTEAFCFDQCNGEAASSTSSGAGGSGGSGGVGGGICFNCQPDSGPPDGCTPTNGGIEICDQLDNDCNGMTDEGFDLTKPERCGSCDNNCYTQLLNCKIVEITCEAPSTCKCGGCSDDYHDLDMNGTCEYFCQLGPDPESICNNRDDDCDGQKDEDVDFCASLADCGQCGNACSFPFATAQCVHTGPPPCNSTNTQCQIAQCDPGHYDLDNSDATGCEYICTPDANTNGKEVCGDGIDNDCDGAIDGADTDLSGDPQIGVVCHCDPDGECGTQAHAGVTVCQGNAVVCTGANLLCENQNPELCNGKDDNCDGSIDNAPTDVAKACGGAPFAPCKPGATQCQSGTLVCVGAINPTAELCNAQDDDCNGTVDDNLTDTGGNCGQYNTPPCKFGTVVCQGGVLACSGAINPTAEICNSVDDDCDGTVDDSPAGTGGTCGTNTGACTTGINQCMNGAIVCAGSIGPQPETCNLIDDDCDGMVDDSPAGAGAQCGQTDTGPCSYGVIQCQTGSLVCIGAVSPNPETCNNIDDDCDGVVDKTGMNPPPDSVGPCNVYPPPPPGATSPCMPGMKQCIGGIVNCVGSVGPTGPDTCGVDANCDGTLTNQPNLQTDINNCGTCGHNCYTGAIHSIWSCVAGTCVFQSCEPGYWDLDGNKTCEYACQYKQAQEICNNEDDNCNGTKDENVLLPSVVQVCGVSPAAMSPECTTNVNIACVAGAWKCTFPAGVCNPTCATATEICDTLDNDCDGFKNENVPNWGKPCASDDGLPPPGHGACKTTGSFVCNGPNATVCSAVKASCSTLPGGCTELCDGIDNDCDGTVDETFNAKGTDTTYFVKPIATKITATRWIYSYEASRPSATAMTPGSGNGYYCTGGGCTGGVPPAPAGETLDKTHACSVAGKIPWFNVNPIEVEQTCQAMGGFVCATADWNTACATPTLCTWGYNPRGAACTSTYTVSKYCNLGPFDFNPGQAGDQDGLLATGSAALQNCWGDWSGMQGNTITTNKILDVTGNLREITKSAANVYPVMGGAFSTADPSGATCAFTFYTVDQNFKLYDLGFRCCFSSDPTL